MVAELHKLFNEQKRYQFPFSDVLKDIPRNGIYILFESGEKYGNMDRIVRVGTHNGQNKLRSRLKEHFIKENKNRSIFRKNIGRCFLNKEKHPYLNLWELDITSKIDRERNLQLLNLTFELQMEKRISGYIRTNFSFCTFSVETKKERLFWESKIASTLATQSDIRGSKDWLGLHSPKEKIKLSGLWQVNGLNNACLTNQELIQLQRIIIGSYACNL